MIAITESWCNNLISDAKIQLDDYNMSCLDRNTVSDGSVFHHIISITVIRPSRPISMTLSIIGLQKH